MNFSQQRLNLLTGFPWLKRILMSRAFQPIMMLITLVGFALAILTGLFGTPAGSRNFGIIFVWIVWWALLIIMIVPLLGRAWCTVCPIPAPGEWLQRGGIIDKLPGKLRTLGWRWPRRFKNIWLQNIGFMGVAIFSAVILTQPSVSALVLLGFVLVGMILSMLFEKRTFCKYVCPVGGFIGLYSMAAPTELRVIDTSVCVSHTPKDCITGNEYGYGCPWMTYPGHLQRNIDCGLCMECLKTCPHDNIVINVRPPGTDLLVHDEHRLDEAFKAFIMLGCALLYSAVLLGPWGWIKQWAALSNPVQWVLYAVGFIAIVMGILPGLFWLSTTVARHIAGNTSPVKQLFVSYAYALVPLGLAAWIAFSFSFVLTNGSYAISVISDPFGWGWNLFGTAGFPWAPIDPSVIAFLQTGVLIGGLAFAIRIAIQIAGRYQAVSDKAMRMSLPVIAFMLLTTLGFLGLYLG